MSAAPALDGIANQIWTIAIKTRNGLKRAGILGPLDGLSAYLGPRLLPPPTTDAVAKIALGLELTVPPRYPSYRNFATGLYEADVTEIVLSTVTRGMTVVDLGANIGYYTLLASTLVGSEGHVYAFEPDLEAFKYLQTNIARNQCANVVPVNMAAGDKVEAVSFVRPGPERGFVSTSQPHDQSVQATTLDAFFGRLGWPAVDLIKLDIEGSELLALIGMEELVRRNGAIQLIVELNTEAITRAGRTLEELIETLNRLGFSSGYLIEQRKRLRLRSLLPGSRAVHNLLLGGPRN